MTVARRRSRGISLRRMPRGLPRLHDFEVTESVLDPLGPEELLVHNTFFSVDASVRLRMTSAESSYLPSYGIGSPLDGWAVGDVLESTSSRFVPGDTVLHYLGWRDVARAPVDGPAWTAPRIAEGRHPAQAYLGPLGPSGLTSWAGLTLAGELRVGDIVYISAGAGAVGLLAVQLAKQRGHRVVASAGSPEKVRYVIDVLGADAAFDYHDGVADGLARCAPDGIDVYFDNVGGGHLDAALDVMRPGGRVALCGAISDYNSDGRAPTGVTRLFAAIERGVTLRGFLARMYADHWGEFDREVGSLLHAGALVYPEVVHDGVEAGPAALIGVLTGANLGKSLVRIPAGVGAV